MTSHSGSELSISRSWAAARSIQAWRRSTQRASSWHGALSTSSASLAHSPAAAIPAAARWATKRAIRWSDATSGVPGGRGPDSGTIHQAAKAFAPSPPDVSAKCLGAIPARRVNSRSVKAALPV